MGQSKWNHRARKSIFRKGEKAFQKSCFVCTRKYKAGAPLLRKGFSYTSQVSRSSKATDIVHICEVS
jgi:hypothetical protein